MSCCFSSCSRSARMARTRSSFSGRGNLHELHKCSQHECQNSGRRRHPGRVPCRHGCERSGQVERGHVDRGSRVDCPRSRRRQGERHRSREGLPGSAFRRTQAELHPRGQSSGSLHCRRPRARNRLAAAAADQQPQREDPAGRPGLPGCVAECPHPGNSDRPDHARHGRRPPARQPALLAGAWQRTPDRPGDSKQAVRTRARRTRRTSRSATTISIDGLPPPRSGGTRRWRRTKAPRW